MRKLLCINSSFNNPYINLATEEYLLKNTEHDIFMLYSNTPSIIIGKHQNALSEINLDYVEKNQLKVVRRLSGGGTVYHDSGNVNYSWIMHGEQGKIIDFKKYTDDISVYLQSLAVHATRNKNNDLLIDGKKISGNAEHIFKNKLIHHGTLLFSTELDKLTNAIKVDLNRFKDKSVQSKRSRVTNISYYLKKDISIQKFCQGLLNFIIAKYDNAIKYQLSKEQLGFIKQLSTEKYNSWDWNFGYSPKYLFKKELQVQNNTVSISLYIKKGKILDIEFVGNFFNDEEISIFKKNIIGIKHRKADIQKIVQMESFKVIFNKLSRENILGLFF
ncbi:MAG: lipoate--protein ligase family protein [Bacteroidetes bacterium]|nr:MAG: lipoate--protein ligase family protein [Bacteroidota bacterium]